jgi:hypothetical protein
VGIVGGDYRGGRVEGESLFLHPLGQAPRDVALRDSIWGELTILTLPDELEGLLERIDPDYLGYDATFHSPECYTIILLTLDYRYTAWRAHLSLDGRWTLSPLDWAGTFRLVQPAEGEEW